MVPTGYLFQTTPCMKQGSLFCKLDLSECGMHGIKGKNNVLVMNRGVYIGRLLGISWFGRSVANFLNPICNFMILSHEQWVGFFDTDVEVTFLHLKFSFWCSNITMFCFPDHVGKIIWYFWWFFLSTVLILDCW